MSKIISGIDPRDPEETPLRIAVENGRISEVSNEDAPDATVRGFILPLLVNAHTHVGDSAFFGTPELPTNVAELVGPRGWKHKMLTQTPTEKLTSGVEQFLDASESFGTHTIIDYREGGVKGIEMLRGIESDVHRFILGRPIADESADLVTLFSDGIGASGLRDLDAETLDEYRSACSKRNKFFSVHVSEDKRDKIDAAITLEPHQIVHLSSATKGDIAQAIDEEIHITVCPRSNRFFGLKPPIQQLVEGEAKWSIGTDNGMLASPNLMDEFQAARDVFPKLSERAFLTAISYSPRELLPKANRQAWPPKIGDPLQFIIVPEGSLQSAPTKPGFVVPS